MIPRPAACLLVAAVALAMGGLAPPVWGQSSQPSSAEQPAVPQAVLELQGSLTQVIAKVEPSVVAISRAPAAEGEPRQSGPFPGFQRGALQLSRQNENRFQPTGTGVVIDAEGLILTQYLNVRSGDEHLVTTTGGESIPATIKGADPRSGLAVLEVETRTLTAIELGDGDRVEKGQFVVTVGNPQAIIADGEPSASWGMVSNLAQRATPTTNMNNALDENGLNYQTTLHHLGTLLQTDAKLNWAVGGGAVVDLTGRLIGITTTAGTLPGHESSAGYAIPMTSTFRRVIEDLKAGREVEYGLLGLSLEPPITTPEQQSEVRGAVVARTVSGSAADRAGIRTDDRLVEIDGKPVQGVSDLQLLVGSLPPSKPISVGLIRAGRRVDLQVSLSKYHVQGEKIYTAEKRSWRGLQVDYSTAIPYDEMLQASQASLIDNEGCVAVTHVAEDSPAFAAGIRKGMFISHVQGERVISPDQFYEAAAAIDGPVRLQFTATTSTAGGVPEYVTRTVEQPR